MDLKVVHIDETTRAASLRLSSKIAEGMDELIQIVILSLLNVPGKDVLDPDLGGGVPALVGSNFSLDDPEELYAEIQQRVNKTRREIIAQQVGLNRPAAAKLKSLGVKSIEQGSNVDEVLVTLRLSSELGETSDVVV